MSRGRRVIGGARRLSYDDRYDRDDVRGFPCRTCGARLRPDAELDTPEGTLRVKISGEFDARDVQPGSPTAGPSACWPRARGRSA